MKKPFSTYNELMNLSHVFYDMDKNPLNLGDKVEIKQHKRNGTYQLIQGEIKQISTSGISLILLDGKGEWVSFDWKSSKEDRTYTMIGKEPEDGRYPWKKEGYIKIIN